MSRNTKQEFKLTMLAAALLAAYGPVFAAEGQENSVSVGVGNWSDDRPQRGIYDGMRKEGGYLLLDADIMKRDDATGTWLGLRARNLGLDNREIKGDWLRQGDIGGSIEYSRISRDSPYTINTGLRGIGTTTQTVVNIAPGSAPSWDGLNTTRERVTAKFFKSFGPELMFNASLRNETKEGNRLWGRGGAAEFALEPIDSTIRIMEGSLNYSRGDLQLSGGYYGTTYDNANSMVTAVGAATFFLSLPLSNRSHEVFLNGGYSFTPTMRGTFKASYSRATQDEPLGNFGGTASPLAPTNLNGRLDTTLLEAGLSAKPTSDLSVVANLRYRDFADKTPVYGIVFTGTTPTVYNTPFSYTNAVGKLEGNYRLPHGMSLLGGIEYNSQDRQIPNVGTLWVPFRAKLDETTYRVQMRKSMSETINGSLAYMYMDRNGSAFKVPAAAGETLQDRINPMNIADRQRDKWRAMVDWSPADRLAFQFAFEDSQDRYQGPNTYGLQGGSARLYSLDASYQMSAAWALNAWISRDENKADEITQNTVAVTKYNNLSEIGNSFGAGVTGKISEKLKMGGNVEQFRSVNEYNQFIVGAVLPATQVRTPNITNTLLRFKLFADYAVQKNADLRFQLIYEKWSTDDWTWMMFPASGRTPWAYGTTTDGTTITTDPKQTSTFVGVRYTYRFQ